MKLSEPREKDEEGISLGKGSTYIYGAKLGTTNRQQSTNSGDRRGLSAAPPPPVHTGSAEAREAEVDEAHPHSQKP